MKQLNLWKEAWSAIPATIFTLAGFAVCVSEGFSDNAGLIWAGVFLGFLGLLMDLSVRLTLVQEAGFGFLETKRLRITDGHHLITNGIFGHIRHPLYLGRISMNFGFVLLFPSFWGAVLMAIASLSYGIRIQIEEEMLTEEFGDAYHEYRKHTKRIIPLLY